MPYGMLPSGVQQEGTFSFVLESLLFFLTAFAKLRQATAFLKVVLEP